MVQAESREAGGSTIAFEIDKAGVVAKGSALASTYKSTEVSTIVNDRRIGCVCDGVTYALTWDYDENGDMVNISREVIDGEDLDPKEMETGLYFNQSASFLRLIGGQLRDGIAPDTVNIDILDDDHIEYEKAYGEQKIRVALDTNSELSEFRNILQTVEGYTPQETNGDVILSQHNNLIICDGGVLDDTAYPEKIHFASDTEIHFIFHDYVCVWSYAFSEDETIKDISITIRDRDPAEE